MYQDVITPSTYHVIPRFPTSYNIPVQLPELVLQRIDPVVENQIVKKRQRKQRNWNPEDKAPRRSERIRLRMLKKKEDRIARKKSEETNQKQKCRARKKRTFRRKNGIQLRQTVNDEGCDDPPTASQVNIESYENRKAEKVLGQRRKGGKNFILVKWEGIQAPEYLEKSNLSNEILKLYQTYMEEELSELRTVTSDAEESRRITIIKKEPSLNVTYYSWDQFQIAEEMEESHPNPNCLLSVKLE